MLFGQPLSGSIPQRRPDPLGGAALSSLGICSIVPGGLSAGAASVGVLPDMATWSEADILLFAQAPPGPAAVLIEAAQTRRYGGGAIWTHAALYIGGGQLIESIVRRPTMVLTRGVDAHVPGAAIMRMHDPRLSPADRAALIAEASLLLRKPYSLTRAARVGAQLLVGRPRRTRQGRLAQKTVIRGCICSDVIELAYNDALGLSASPDARGLVAPAAFYDNPALQRCPVQWCRLP